MRRWSLALLVLAGCSASSSLVSTPDHPASPRAAEAPMPSPSTALASPPAGGKRPTTPEAGEARATERGHGAHGGHR